MRAAILTTALAPLLLGTALARDASPLQRKLMYEGRALADGNTTHSMNVSSCPGYTLGSVSETENSLTASLSLAGNACNAFGNDISNLTIQVTYETKERLHVKISDTADSQFVIPESVFARPNATSGTTKNSSDLAFNYDSSPFAFWITRASDPSGVPLFDTRIASLPQTPIPPYNPADNQTALDGFPLVFEDQYLQLTSALPHDANIYGLGEVVSSSGFRRDVAGPNGTIQTNWARDVADPIDQNEYGIHPVYMEHRLDESGNTSQTHGVFLLSPNGADILLATPPGSNTSLVEYRMIGGILDFYFLSGPDPKSVIEQYGAVVGLPTPQPAWGFGFHLCRWGYANVSQTMDNVRAMRDANIPLEVQWNDIDLYQAYRDFTTDNGAYPPDELRAFIQNLTANHQHYIPIVDAAIAKETNSTDVYPPYRDGVAQKVFVNNPDGSEYVGQVWPGFTVFPDWFANNTQSWWTQALQNWSDLGVEYSGIWLDMNEASSFCEGSCGSNADLSKTAPPFALPGTPENEVTDYPECYDSSASGPSGNITVNGKSTNSCGASNSTSANVKRGLGAGNQTDININFPPYAIHNGAGPLSKNTIAVNATHAPGYIELDTHNLFGTMEEMTTNRALQQIRPGKRPFIIGRSTFASAGKWTGHWLGDNFSQWAYLYFNIQGVLQFQLFQIPMVGADTCGFNGNTDEELCNRWMQMSAFVPFYRNHNTKGALSQEPYRWDSVANASRIAIAARYALLPYWYTLFMNSSTQGTPPVRALWYEFPTEKELFPVDTQFLVGGDILVTPVLQPGVTTVEGIFPGRGTVTWRDWWTHDVVNATSGANTTLDAPLSHINVHIRDRAALLLHAQPAYTINETRAGPYALLVSQAPDGSAFGTAYVDDGDSYPPGPGKTVTFTGSKNQIEISASGDFNIEQKLQNVTVLGVASKPSNVTVGGTATQNFTYADAQQELVVSGVNVDLNSGTTISWS